MLELLSAETATHLELARELFQEYASSLGFDLDFQNFEDELTHLPGDYAPPAGCLLLAMYRGEAAGCVASRKLTDTICEMKRLYVRPQYRRLGIGRALAQAVINEAKAIGYTRMRLDTLPSMKAARSLYTSLGFKETEPYRHNPIDGALFIELILV